LIIEEQHTREIDFEVGFRVMKEGDEILGS